ncbi:alpha/beta hydrolase [Colwelliaceae bacterium 6441]
MSLLFSNRPKSPLKFFTLLLSAILSISVFSQEAALEQQTDEPETVNQVKFMTQDKFMLSGQYYAGKADHSGVLLLHDCSNDSRSYDKLTELLAQYGLHAFALDLRGHGDSVNEKFSHYNVKRNSKDIVTYQSETARISSYWQSDVMEAFNYLRTKVNKKRDIAVVTAGCSSAQAVFLAQKMRIKSFVMISPTLNYMEKEHYKNLIDIPVYFIDSAHHADTYQTSKELFDWNGDSRSIFQIFKGIKQGHSLLKSKRYLSHDVALWLDDTLSK